MKVKYVLILVSRMAQVKLTCADNGDSRKIARGLKICIFSFPTSHVNVNSDFTVRCMQMRNRDLKVDSINLTGDQYMPTLVI